MPTDRETKQAARLLRGYKRRVEKLEEQREPEGDINLLRFVDETVACDDSVATSVNTGATFVVGESTTDGSDLTG